MQIHRIRGRDLHDALEKAQRLHGSDALVLTHEAVPGGVTVAVTAAKGRRGPSGSPLTTGEHVPGLDGVERAMRRTGCSDALLADVLRAVRASGARGAYTLDVAARELGARVAVAPSPKAAPRKRLLGRRAERASNAIAFVGPTGVGKTTTIAKLATRLVKAGRRVALVNLDTQRVGAGQQLAEYGRLLQVPVDDAHDRAELEAILERSRHLDLVLIDTTGRSPLDAQLLGEMEGTLAAPQTYLVASAVTSESVLDELGRGFARLEPQALVLTKLDETRTPAPALEFAMRAGLPVSFLCDGQAVAGHLHRPTADHFADLFLRGRLA